MDKEILQLPKEEEFLILQMKMHLKILLVSISLMRKMKKKFTILGKRRDLALQKKI